MKALIIGADGFVGNYLYDIIIQNSEYKIYRTSISSSFSESNSNSFVMDICEIGQVESVLEKVNPDYIFHLAAQASVGVSWQNPQITFEINTIGFLNIVQTIKKLNLASRLLVIGSSEEYGIVGSDPINENNPVNPQNPYAISKYSQELLSNIYTNYYDMDIVQTRSFNHIGVGQSDGFVVSDFSKKIVMIEKGLMQPILNVGNLEAKRDFTDVRDIVCAYDLLMKKGVRGEIYNVGSNKVYSIREILSILQNLSIKNFDVKIDKNKFRPIDVPIIQCDNSKLKKDTGWQPKLDITNTLEDILNYYRKII